MSEHLTAELEYWWSPFTVDRQHLTFLQHVHARLASHRCSHWGPAVYKWEGPLTEGGRAGQVGVLIGETGDLRARIKQYVSGTQARGNKLWRESFLACSEARLYVLGFHSLSVSDPNGKAALLTPDAVASPNARLVLEQLLVMRAVSTATETTWVVNARQ